MPIPEVVRELHASDRFLVTVHVNPDGDALGALLGMVRLLDGLGKHAVPVMPEPVPPRYRFLAGADRVMTVPEAEKAGPFDAMIVLDVGDYDRIGDVQQLFRHGMRLVNIDHHISNKCFGEACWIDTGASASCEMLVELFREAKVAIEPDVAELLYTGIMTDTGRFRFSNTTAKVFAVCANLVSRGADPEKITERIYYRAQYDTLRTMGRMLERIELFEEGSLAFSHLAESEAGSDTEGFIDKLMSIETVQVAALIRPVGDREWKFSLRSKCDVNVSDLAAPFNGGGHAKAAGGKVTGSLDEAKQQVVEACINALRQQKG